MDRKELKEKELKIISEIKNLKMDLFIVRLQMKPIEEVESLLNELKLKMKGGKADG